jgi:hypothetical protein
MVGTAIIVLLKGSSLSSGPRPFQGAIGCPFLPLTEKFSGSQRKSGMPLFVRIGQGCSDLKMVWILASPKAETFLWRRLY